MDTKHLDLIRNAALFKKQYHSYIANAIKDLSITCTEFSYLKELIYNDGVIQDVLVQNTCIDKAAASRATKSLEQQNLIIRVKNESDKRSLNVFLTDEGKKLVPIISSILDEWYSILSESIGKEKLELFNSLFTQLNEQHPK